MYVEFNQYEKLIVIEAVKDKLDRDKRKLSNDDVRDLQNALDKLNG